jgi:Kef-type K+ transport system membrane component KefB/Trk K+ transport system NAD-binding subunit
MQDVFTGLSLVIITATVVALVMRFLKQPIMIGHIITGIIVGPAVFHVIKSPDTFKTFSDIGIALLLFIIGLGLNPKVIKQLGKVVTVAGLSEISATAIIGWAGGRLMGLSGTESLFLGIALSFSSTIVVLKLLADKKEQGRLYGKIAIGLTLVEDIVATLAILLLTAKGANHGWSVGAILFLAAKGIIAGYGLYWLSSRILPKMHSLIADNSEFLFLFAIAWGFGGAVLFDKIGLAREVGALFAGVCLSTLPYAQEIASRLRPLRDFFVVLFFVTLGANLHLNAITSMLPVILVGTLVVAVIKPFVGYGAVSLVGYTKRTSFKSGAMLGQAGEFSIIFMVLGTQQHLVGNKLLSALTMIVLLSIVVSTYLITYLDKIYKYLENHNFLLERRKLRPEHESRRGYDLVLFGYGKGGHEFLRVFQSLKKPYVVVDYDPEMIDAMEYKKINCLYGDANDIELLEEAGVDGAKLIVSMLTDQTTSEFLLRYVDKHNPDAVVICTGDTPKEAAAFYKLGASYVMLPHYIGSEKISNFVRRAGLSKREFDKFRAKHIEHMETHKDPLNLPEEENKEDQHSKKLGAAIVKGVAALAKPKS